MPTDQIATAAGEGDLTLRMQSDLGALERTIETITHHCIACGLPGRTARFNLRVALAEALSNAIIYGNSSDPAKTVRVDVDVRDARVSITIADEGAGFDPDDVPDPTSEDRIQNTSGRGIFLIRQLVDDVMFNDRGNVICLCLNLPDPDADQPPLGRLDDLVRGVAELLGAPIRLWWVADGELQFLGGTNPAGAAVRVNADGGVVADHGIVMPVPDVVDYYLESPEAVDLDIPGRLLSRIIEVEGDIVGVAEELTARYEEIDLLYTISDVLGRTMELEEAAEIILREVSSVVGARRASIFVHDPDVDSLLPVAGWGLDIGEFGSIPVDHPKSVAARVFRENNAATGSALELGRDRGLPARRQAYRGNAYLSAPITHPGPDGVIRPVGVMNLTDRLGADAFSSGDRKLIDAIAHQVGAAVENTRLVGLDRQRQRVRRELELAADLQLRLLPGVEVLAGRVDVAARCSPGELVGGDFYNFVPLGGSEIGVMLGDVSTHGFPAALIMALCLSASGIHAAAADSPEQALQDLLASVSSELSTTEMYLTLFYGVIDTASRRVRYANAGHPHAFLVPPQGDATRLEATVPPLGLVDGIEITGAEAAIESKGDLLIVFSDGICDACDASGTAFSEARVLDLVRLHHAERTEAIVASVFEAVDEFSTIAPDDQTFLAVRT